MIKSIVIAAILAVGSAGGALAQTRTINVWGAQLEVPTYGATAPNGPAISRYDRDSATFTAMKSHDAARDQHRNR
ncbi:hypothetical protein [Methylobacterium brachythecii]|uniref:Uncharacterized protein n=1 Tax=Methylobacterium brachythecii TaxID=1176177 RepID=A0A7W6ALC8_9HYPH|nr:hypothetical protein [Methylobacterium brachythecii]MBB3903849.1 hypothetical protein [Methylobacterium brachythecii]GLS44778.1 hypothetical protein GCM10007884_27670 [Methylobacterium brachythecii]